jgi:DNA polymerase III epsilon subunit-like protein
MERLSRMTHWTKLNYVVVDVEGNGHQPPDLVELAAVPIVDGTVGESKRAGWFSRISRSHTALERFMGSPTSR